MSKPPPAQPSSRALRLEEAQRRPSAAHLHAVRTLANSYPSGPFIPIRRSFISGSPQQPPLLSDLLHRAGLDAVELKLVLLILWLGAWAQHPKRAYDKTRRPLGDHTVSYQPAHFATALDLPEARAGGKQTRRVRDAVRRLENRNLLQDPVRPDSTGRRRVLDLLREDGSGSLYTNPAWHRLHTGEIAKEGRFIQLPNTLFRNGWLSALSGSALATWLVLEDSASLRQRQTPSENKTPLETFISPRLRRERYHISADTFLNGRAELIAHGLLSRSDKTYQVAGGRYHRREILALYKGNFAAEPVQAIVPELLPGRGRTAPTTADKRAKLPHPPFGGLPSLGTGA